MSHYIHVYIGYFDFFFKTRFVNANLQYPQNWSELVRFVAYITCNDISVIYVTVHRCTGGLKKKFDLRSGCQRHRHFVEFFNVPVQASTRDQPFYGYSEKPPQFIRLLRHARGYGGHILALTTGFPWGHRISTCINWQWHYLTLMKLFLILISSSEVPPGKFWEMYIEFEEMVNS